MQGSHTKDVAGCGETRAPDLYFETIAPYLLYSQHLTDLNNKSPLRCREEDLWLRQHAVILGIIALFQARSPIFVALAGLEPATHRCERCVLTN